MIDILKYYKLNKNNISKKSSYIYKVNEIDGKTYIVGETKDINKERMINKCRRLLDLYG